MSKTPNHSYRPYRVRRAGAPPLVAALLIALGAALCGCSRSPGISSLLGGTAVSAAVIDGRVAAAAAAFSRGDSRAANAALEDAVRMAALGMGEGTGAAYVAEGLTRHGRPTEAARLLTQAVQRPAVAWNPLAWDALAEAQRKAGNPDEAIRAAEEAGRRAGEIRAQAGTAGKPAGAKGGADAAARFRTAGLYYADARRKDGPAAIAVLREAYRLDPEDPNNVNALGYILADLGATAAERVEAVRLTRKAAEMSGDDPGVLDSYGWALFKNNDLAGARRVLREAVDRAPGSAESRFHLGVAYAALGLYRDAALELDRALRLRPDYPEAQAVRSALPADALTPPSPPPSPSPSPLPSPSPTPSSAAR